jgi:hypothetical protein
MKQETPQDKWNRKNIERIRAYQRKYSAQRRAKLKVALSLIEEKGLKKEFEERLDALKK